VRFGRETKPIFKICLAINALINPVLYTTIVGNPIRASSKVTVPEAAIATLDFFTHSGSFFSNSRTRLGYFVKSSSIHFRCSLLESFSKNFLFSSLFTISNIVGKRVFISCFLLPGKRRIYSSLLFSTMYLSTKGFP